MTGAATTHGTNRMSAAALILLASAVALGASFLGAPPRFSAGASGPPWLRVFLVSLTPLAVVEAAVAVALGLLVAAECVRREHPGLPGGRAAARTRLPLVMLFVLGCVQLVPLPSGVLHVVAPFSADTYASLRASGDDTMRPMSLWPAGTAHALFNLAGVVAASAATWALVRGGAGRRVATMVLLVVAVLATSEAAHGIIATKFGDDRLLGTFEKASDNGRVTGTFIHGTMMAVWAGMGACAALGLAAAAALDKPRWSLASAAVGAAGACVVAAGLALSRLGVVAVPAGLLVTWSFVATTLWRDGRRRIASAMGAVALFLVVGAGAAVFAFAPLRERFGYFVTSHGLGDLRLPTWRSTWALFLHAPVVGTGLGSFGRAIHLAQSIDCPQELWFAHSDPLNLLSDVGVVGSLLGLWWIVAIVRRGLPAIRLADVGARCLAAGAFGAAVVVLVASLGDFQTQFPVVAIPFAALITIPAALADAASGSPDVEPRAWLLPPRMLAAGVLAVAALFAASPLVDAFVRMREIRDFGVTGATRAEALIARGKADLETVPKSKTPRADLTRAESSLRQAARLDPLLDEAHLWTAFAALYLDEPRDDVLRALGRARVVARGDARTNLLVGLRYLDFLGTSAAPYGPPGDDAVAALREAGALEPKAFVAAWTACLEHGLPVETLRAVAPDRGYAKIRLSEHLRSLGLRDEADEVLSDQLRREPWDVEVGTRLAAALHEAGKDREGRSYFESVGARWPDSK